VNSSVPVDSAVFQQHLFDSLEDESRQKKAARVMSPTRTASKMVRPAGLEPATRGLRVRCSDSVTPDTHRSCDDAKKCVPSHVPFVRQKCPGLAAVIDAWPDLSEDVRQNVLSAVRREAGHDADSQRR